ncbi:unnamed protein product, partial [marine sediment metagenome]
SLTGQLILGFSLVGLVTLLGWMCLTTLFHWVIRFVKDAWD